MERGWEIGAALSLLELLHIKVSGKHSSSFNRQQEVSPAAMESSNHVCYRQSADWESQPDADLGVPVWAFRRDTHLLALVGGELKGRMVRRNQGNQARFSCESRKRLALRCG